MFLVHVKNKNDTIDSDQKFNNGRSFQDNLCINMDKN